MGGVAREIELASSREVGRRAAKFRFDSRSRVGQSAYLRGGIARQRQALDRIFAVSKQDWQPDVAEKVPPCEVHACVRPSET